MPLLFTWERDGDTRFDDAHRGCTLKPDPMSEPSHNDYSHTQTNQKFSYRHSTIQHHCQ